MRRATVRISHSLRYRLTMAATALFVLGTLVVAWQLLLLQRELSQRDGENMVWALAQTRHQALSLERDLARLRLQQVDAEQLALQSDLLDSRLALLADGPQRRTLQHYEVLAPVDQAVARYTQIDPLQWQSAVIPEDAQEVLKELIAALSRAGNQVMVLEREERSAHLARLARWIQAAFAAIAMVVLCGSWLLWQLVAGLRRQRASAVTIGAQRDALQKTVDDLHRAQDASETYRNFVSLVSHQFRTPLAVIDSAAQRLARRARQPGADLAAPVLERMGQVRSTVDGMTRLLDSVLTSIKLDGSGIELQCQPLDLAAILRQVLADNQSLLAGRPLHWAQDDSPAACAGDAQLLSHLLHNLLANACKYTPQGSALEISLRADAQHLYCRLRDVGPGVSAQELPLLFERFYRGAGSRGQEGSGLGLYLARAIARLHGGELSADCPKEGGLALTLRLPRREEPAARD